MTKNDNKMYVYGKRAKTDKILKHKYHRTYPVYLQGFYDIDNGGIVEIGVQTKESLKMWIDLFPKIHIYGLDIGAENKVDGRISLIQVDQGEKDELEHAMEQIKHKVYIINDDGSHVPEHQLLTFNIFFPMLEKGGVYIIEDIETSYWVKGKIYQYPTNYGIGNSKSIIEIFKCAIDYSINKRFVKKNSVCKVEHLEWIHSITFAYNSIVIVKKNQIDNFGKYHHDDYL